MGLTYQSTGISTVAGGELKITRSSADERVIALAGNPNVGKSTVFNALTGLNQHTGNWPGKTVTNAQGRYSHRNKNFILVDIPGTYSLMASSPEEEVARDFVCFGEPDGVVIVADATCLERNLNLVLQILEVTHNVVVCINLLDEARKKGIHVDLDELSLHLGVPVVGASARAGEGLQELMDEIYLLTFQSRKTFVTKTDYGPAVESALSLLQQAVEPVLNQKLDIRWLSLKLLDFDSSLHLSVNTYLGYDILQNEAVCTALSSAQALLNENKLGGIMLRDHIVSRIVQRAEEIYRCCVKTENETYNRRDRKIDRILTSRHTGIPVMIALLALIFWLTISGANYPSSLLSKLFFFLEEKLYILFESFRAPEWLQGVLITGCFRTLAWVVSVMLPPMAIFFPLFTLLEDSGYLPRIAFNMDKFFKKANAHGKQSLSMCMGFGCNACGVIGCRIIDSPRERLIAILTNSFVPCNGRFPTLIALITMFFSGMVAFSFRSLFSTLFLTSLIVLSVFMTLLASKLLSRTVLKGLPSSFVLELPPYRRPQIGKVIVRSVFDRTLFVLGRAAAVAAPAGIVIWLLSNIQINGLSILSHCTGFLDPFARAIGLDGVILMAFFLGFPANEIVFPIIIMSYLCSGSMMAMEDLTQLHALLSANGWTWLTAGCTILFSLMHFPCATTCWTIAKETKSLKWTLLAILLPTGFGMAACFFLASAARLAGIA